MLKQIKNTNEVASFTKQLVKEGVNFHPNDDFNDYVVLKTNKPFYEKKNAEVRNKLMDECFRVCEKEGTDIYSVMHEVFLIETGMNKFIPLPSQEPFEA